MTAPLDAFEASLRIAQALERGHVSYALGGALAYGQYGIPRATNDVDVNVFVEPASLAPVVGALRSLGIAVDDRAAREQAEAEGLFVVEYEALRVDVFTPSIAFSWEAERTRVRQTIDGVSVWFLSVEALCVFKMLFFRGKDVVDMERLIAVQGDAIDRAYVRSQLVDMMGPADPRVKTWDRLWSVA